MRKLWLAIGITSVLAGCGTTQTSMSEARPVPPAFVYTSQRAPSQDEAKLTVIRDSGFAGGGCRVGLFVDGKRMADLEPKEMITVHVKSGQRILGVGPAADGRGLCSLVGSEVMREREAQFAPGQERYFRMSVVTSGDLDLSPVTRP